MRRAAAASAMTKTTMMTTACRTRRRRTTWPPATTASPALDDRWRHWCRRRLPCCLHIIITINCCSRRACDRLVINSRVHGRFSAELLRSLWRLFRTDSRTVLVENSGTVVTWSSTENRSFCCVWSVRADWIDCQTCRWNSKFICVHAVYQWNTRQLKCLSFGYVTACGHCWTDTSLSDEVNLYAAIGSTRRSPAITVSWYAFYS